MNNTTNAALYAAAGGTVGFGIAHVCKLTGNVHLTWGLIIAGALAGGLIGNNT